MIKAIKRFFRFIFKCILYGILTIIGIKLLVFFLGSNSSDSYSDYEDDTKTEYYQDENKPDREKNAVHYCKWKAPDGNKYKYTFKMYHKNYEKARKNREGIEVYGTTGFNRFEKDFPYTSERYFMYWAFVYHEMLYFDENLLNSYLQTFDKIKKEHNPGYREFAEIIISQTQAQPYFLVHENSCEEYMKKYRENGWDPKEDYHGKKCKPNIKYSVQSPVEFAYNLKGDCDTRSVFLYAILKHYGYDVAVVLSKAYSHVILGIAMPSQGKYITYNRKKYYLVETTGKNWDIGELSSKYKNLNNWNIVVTN